jgi:hypothetical protein
MFGGKILPKKNSHEAEECPVTFTLAKIIAEDLCLSYGTKYLLLTLVPIK